MVSNVTSVTAAPARTPEPTVQQSNGAASGLPGGNGPPVAGRDLPLEQAPVSPADLEGAVQRLTELVCETRRSLQFRIDEASGRTVITVLNEHTQEVVRQIPSEEVLAVLRHLEQTGVLLDAYT